MHNRTALDSRALAVIDAIMKHKLFDCDYYLRQNHDVACQTEVAPLEHYMMHGGFEGRNPHALFDSAFYLRQVPELAQEGINPLLHFLGEGARQGLNPHPLFSIQFYLEQDVDLDAYSSNALIHYLECGARQGLNPHQLFDSAYYLQQLEQAEADVAGNPLVHYLTVGASLGLNPTPIFDGEHYKRRYPDVAAAGVNPLLHFASTGQFEDRVGRRLSSIADGAHYIKNRSFQSALLKLQQATLEPLSHVLIIDSLARGGVARCICNFYQAICRKTGTSKVLLLVTDDKQITCTDWLPEGVRLVNLLELEPTLSSDERAILFLELLFRTRPAISMCFNSPTFWNAIDYHSDVCKKELSTRLVAYLGGYEDYVIFNGWGFNHGPINRLAGVLDLFVTDNERLRTVMIDLHSSVPSIEQKVVTCYKSLTDDLLNSLQQKDACRDTNSANSGTPLSSKACFEKGKILWASRLDRVKQPEVLASIARQMPDVQFEVYGRCMPGIDVSYLDEIPNVSLCGEYSDFSAIPTEDKAAFLHTSKSDSMPHVLIEAAACGLPVIAPHIGAIGELIDDKTGWLVKDSGDSGGYVEAIRNVLANPEQSQQRASRLKALINERHTWSAFLTRVDKLDVWQ